MAAIRGRTEIVDILLAAAAEAGTRIDPNAMSTVGWPCAIQSWGGGWGGGDLFCMSVFVYDFENLPVVVNRSHTGLFCREIFMLGRLYTALPRWATPMSCEPYSETHAWTPMHPASIKSRG